MNTWDERSHPAYPAGLRDPDRHEPGRRAGLVRVQPGTGGLRVDRRQSLVYVQKAGSASAARLLLLDADLNSSNRIFTAPMSVMGLTATSQFDFTVLAYDNYFSGLVTDAIGPMRYTAGTPRYLFGGDLGDGTCRPARPAPCRSPRCRAARRPRRRRPASC